MKPNFVEIEAIYQTFMDNVDLKAWSATESMLISFVKAYGACSYEELSMYMGMDIYQTRELVKQLRLQKRLAEEGLITI